jgi:hypothetical protein
LIGHIPAQRDNHTGFVRYAEFSSGWIPACAGMTCCARNCRSPELFLVAPVLRNYPNKKPHDFHHAAFCFVA